MGKEQMSRELVIGLIALEDVVKESTKEAIDRLHQLGLKTFMITGDNKKVAHMVGEQVGIDEVIAEILPLMWSGLFA